MLIRSRRTRLLGSTLAALCLLACASAAHGQTRGESPLPAPTGMVNDYAGVIDPSVKQRLETILTNLKERAQIEFAVVTVPTTGDRPIFDYTLAVARGWGIGAKDGEKKGIILLAAINDRKYFMQVSRHLEGDLPDGVLGQIGRQRLRPAFAKGDYNQGLTDTVLTIVATLAEKRNFSIEGIDRSYAYREPQRPRSGGRRTESSLGLGACCLIAIVLIILFSMIGGRRGGRGGGGGGGGGLLNALLLANVLSSVASSSRGSSSGWGGFGGGGSSSGWGGGGGGFGGFGGGGDFGGGGAGGDW